MRSWTWLVAAVSLVLTACSSTAVAPSANVPCAPTPNGAVCIKLFTSHAQVQDVIGYLSASNSPLAERTWRLVLGAYPCDPGASPRPACTISATYPGPTMHGTPPASTHCVGSNGATLTDPPGCHDTLAELLATHDDWTGFAPHGLPTTFTPRAWLCVSEQLQINATWVAADDAFATHPLRACARTP